MIEHKDVIEIIKRRIPEFTFDHNVIDSPIIVVSFLNSFLIEAYIKNDQTVIEKCANLFSDLSENADTNIQGLIDETSISLFDHSLFVHEDFTMRLSGKGKHLFANAIKRWTQG